jgi:glyceraldehyde 3-phosphate dehydrogenase
MAFRVPTTDVSVVDLTVKVAKNHTKRLWQFKISFRNYHERVMGYTEDLVVSQDFVSDKELLLLMRCWNWFNTFFKIISW